MPMTTTVATPIVGMHFRPPAKGLLAAAPAGATLRVTAEPDNPHDANALKVEITSKCFLNAERLGEEVAGFGQDAQSIMEQEWWHLGYIPRDQALWLAPQCGTEPIDAVLGFAPNGAPTVTFSLPTEATEDKVEEDETEA